MVVHPLVFRSPLGLCRDIVEYQVRQTRHGADVAVRCQGQPDLGALEAEITAKLVTARLVGAEVRVRAVDQLDRQDTGKLKRFVPSPAGVLQAA